MIGFPSIEEYVKDVDIEGSTDLLQSNPLESNSNQGRNISGWKGALNNFIYGRYFVPVIIVLIAVISFSLGRISRLQDKRPPVRIISENYNAAVGTNYSNVLKSSPDSASQNNQSQSSSINTSGQVVASKNGTRYHYPWCVGAKQISEKNKIVFNSIEEAKAKGYTPASNCKGLK